jgi:hypothetical protein
LGRTDAAGTYRCERARRRFIPFHQSKQTLLCEWIGLAGKFSDQRNALQAKLFVHVNPQMQKAARHNAREMCRAFRGRRRERRSEPAELSYENENESASHKDELNYRNPQLACDSATLIAHPATMLSADRSS